MTLHNYTPHPPTPTQCPYQGKLSADVLPPENNTRTALKGCGVKVRVNYEHNHGMEASEPSEKNAKAVDMLITVRSLKVF